MRPPDNEPPEEEVEDLGASEERKSLQNPNVPEEVRSEIEDHLRRRKDIEDEEARGDS